MYYATIGILGILILIIENQDIFLNREGAFDKPSWRVYRKFLLAVLLYYITDVLWGFLESQKLSMLLFADTSFYFFAMASGVFFWTEYVVIYLEEEKAFGRFFIHTGRVIAAFVAVLSVLNIFFPILFSIDSACVYQPQPFRYVILAAQIILLLLISVYAFGALAMKKREEWAQRYRTVAAFGLTMAFFMVLQLAFPYLPFYAMAYLLGTCLLRAVIIGNEKEAYRRGMEEAKENARKRLLQAQKEASIDALTGVKNKHAFLDEEEHLDMLIGEHQVPQFAIVMLDVNDLKKVNDSKGHQAGDEYLKEASHFICDTFKKSPVYRVGGDEFVVLAEGSDYVRIEELVGEVRQHNKEALANDGVIIACGMARYDRDECVASVFERADHRMYENKNLLKK